jgi:hypothetical protein
MTRRAFTAMELAICLSISAITLPLVYVFLSALDEQHAFGLGYLAMADDVRTVAEELRLDEMRGAPGTGEELTWKNQNCPEEVRYRVNEQGVLLREAPAACGGTRALAGRVQAFTRVPGGVELTFSRSLRPNLTQKAVVFFPLELR